MVRNIKANRIVIKIGTNAITDNSGMLNLKVMQSLASQIAEITNSKDIIIITSGAIGAGMKEINLQERPNDIVMKQVCAAIGQNILMTTYHSLFEKYNIKIAQILLTYDVFSNKKKFLNLRNSMNKLLDLGVIPIINENDSISIDEIGPSFGDNDVLSALITSKMKADLLIILTNVDGLFNKNPNDNDVVLIRDVRKINKKIESVSSETSNLGLGGMKTKIKAAKIATNAGATVVIANGRAINVLIKLLSNENIGTIFYPQK